MIVEVTQGDIDEARRALTSTRAARAFVCPIAQALWRQTRREWSVGQSGVRERLDPALGNTLALAAKVELPQCAVEFVESFDSGAEVHPFSFELPGIEAGYIGNPQREGTAPENAPMQWPTPSTPEREPIAIPESSPAPEAEPEKVGV